MGMGSVIAHVYVFAHVYCSDACSARRSEKGWQDLQRPQGWPRELQTVSPSPIRGSRRSRPKGPHPVRLEARRKPSRRCAWCVVVKREKRKLSTGGLCLTNDLTDHTGNDRAQTRPDPFNTARARQEAEGGSSPSGWQSGDPGEKELQHRENTHFSQPERS